MYKLHEMHEKLIAVAVYKKNAFMTDRQTDRQTDRLTEQTNILAEKISASNKQMKHHSQNDNLSKFAIDLGLDIEDTFFFINEAFMKS